MCYCVTALLTIKMKRFCTLMAMSMVYIKYTLNIPACQRMSVTFVAKRYHVCFFHVHFHVSTYNTEHLTRKVSPPKEKKNSLILIQFCLDIWKLFERSLFIFTTTRPQRVSKARCTLQGPFCKHSVWGRERSSAQKVPPKAGPPLTPHLPDLQLHWLVLLFISQHLLL